MKHGSCQIFKPRIAETDYQNPTPKQEKETVVMRETFTSHKTSLRQINSLVTTAVVDQGISSTTARVRDDTLCSKFQNPGSNSRRSRKTLSSNEVGSKTGDMGSSHGSTRDGVDSGVGANPGRSDIGSGCKDIDYRPEVGVPIPNFMLDSESQESKDLGNLLSSRIIFPNSTNSDGRFRGSRRAG